MLSFKEIQTLVVSKFGFTLSEMTSAEDLITLNLFKSYINFAQEIVYAENKMTWMKKQTIISLKASYSTGTITATQNSASITGDGTTFTRDMEGQKIVITDTTDGDVVYRLKDFTSPTVFSLDGKYIHTGAAGMTYTIYYDEYLLPTDFSSLIEIKEVDVLTGYKGEGYKLLSDYRRDTIELLTEDTTSGVPAEIQFIGFSEKAYYDTGTVSITKGLKAVVGVDTAFDDDFVGRSIYIGTYSKLYEIASVESGTELTINKGFGGTSVDGGKFQVDPPIIERIRFSSSPSAARRVPYVYYKKAIKLQDDEDFSPIPADDVLVLGGIWLYAKNDNQPWQNVALNDFEDAKNRVRGKRVGSLPVLVKSNEA